MRNSGEWRVGSGECGVRLGNGFTVIELLIAMTITLLIAAALAGVALPARDAFERVPAELELHQRGRTAIDVLSQALRSSGKDVAATNGLAPLGDLLPTASLSVPDESGAFTELTVIVPAPHAAQGRLSDDQSGPAGSVALDTLRCPSLSDVCGFTEGATVVIADGAGHYDVFSIESTDAATQRMSPSHALSHAYSAGAVVVEVDRFTFSLAEQADGSYSLIRTSAAGAVQPVVDFVSALTFDAIGRDAPAGFFRLEQVDIVINVETPTAELRQLMTDRVFRTSIRLRNAS